jgi:hypothetical protein
LRAISHEGFVLTSKKGPKPVSKTLTGVVDDMFDIRKLPSCTAERLYLSRRRAQHALLTTPDTAYVMCIYVKRADVEGGNSPAARLGR